MANIKHTQPKNRGEKHTSKRMGNTKGTGGREEESQRTPRQEGADEPATRVKSTKPGPACSKVAKDLPLPMDSDDSDMEAMVDVEGEDSLTDEESSSASTVDAVTGKRKKRGRPTTTYAGLKKFKKTECKREIQRLKAERKALAEALDPKVAPRDTTPERETVRQMEGLNNTQIAAEMLENVNVVLKVAERSKNLKGTWVRELKVCSKNLRAAATVIASKTAGSHSRVLEEETARLRDRVKSLEEQVKELMSLLHQEREARIRAESRNRQGRTTTEETPEMEETPELDYGADNPPRVMARVQVPAKPAKAGKSARPKAQSQKAETLKVAKPESAKSTMDAVRRPMVRGERKELDEPPAEEAMEGIRRVMEGVSIKEVVNGDPQKVKQNLENLITRCQGALTRIPREQQLGKEKNPKKLPIITKVEAVRDKLRVKAREAAAQIVRGTKDEKMRKEETRKEDKTSAKPTTSWAEVVRRGKKKPSGAKQEPATKPTKPAAVGTNKTGEKASGERNGKEAPKRRRAPRTPAVAISFPEGQAGDGMRYLRSQINLEKLEISSLKHRRALNGATLLEIPGGEEAKAKADSLASRIKAVAEEKGVRVSRPAKRAEIRMKDLDESVTTEEVRDAVARVGEGPKEEIKVGSIRHTPSGFGTCWIQCGIEVAKRVAAAKKIKVGWVAARVELLEPRPLVCFKCLERGHVRGQCRSNIHRSTMCYRCGQEGHKAQSCSETPNCAVCSGKGLPSNHKAGGAACRPPSKGEKRREAKKSREEGRTKKKTDKEIVAGPAAEQGEPMETEPAVQVAKKQPGGRNSQEEAGKGAPSQP
ncbi:PREDICTED: caldesmon-like [Vollenhovia emeryi]|uniref:caldesmon-like n=1 Tax=Vollenhovia emeryi TaxID=411798 RepID=UPI0005F469B4|nr:PREDICTED: caldesmon-like [Vollenhovia emeryi]